MLLDLHVHGYQASPLLHIISGPVMRRGGGPSH